MNSPNFKCLICGGTECRCYHGLLGYEADICEKCGAMYHGHKEGWIEIEIPPDAKKEKFLANMFDETEIEFFSRNMTEPLTKISRVKVSPCECGDGGLKKC